LFIRSVKIRSAVSLALMPEYSLYLGGAARKLCKITSVVKKNPTLVPLVKGGASVCRGNKSYLDSHLLLISVSKALRKANAREKSIKVYR
jgi:hypothetical protein